MTPTTSAQLLTEVETLKNMLVARATGESYVDDYFEIRAKLLKAPLVASKLPSFVRSCRTLDEFWGVVKSKFGTYRERREFIREAFDPVLTFLEQSPSAPSDVTIGNILETVDSSHIQAAWHKALERRTTDASGAITSARTLLEAVCKHILDELDAPYDEKADLPQLYGLVATNLKLSPSQHTEQVFRQILGGCHSVVVGLGALRNKLGDAHASGKATVRPAARHAELAVNLAGTMATFLIETWEARQK